jgi:hypothetical protein
MKADTINIPKIPLISPPKTSETASPIPLTRNMIKTVHHAHFIPFNIPHPANIINNPRINMKNPKIIPNVVLLNPVGNELRSVHITSRGVPGIIVDKPTINATNAAMNTIMETNKIPVGLLSRLTPHLS